MPEHENAVDYTGDELLRRSGEPEDEESHFDEAPSNKNDRRYHLNPRPNSLN